MWLPSPSPELPPQMCVPKKGEPGCPDTRILLNDSCSSLRHSKRGDHTQWERNATEWKKRGQKKKREEAAKGPNLIWMKKHRCPEVTGLLPLESTFSSFSHILDLRFIHSMITRWVSKAPNWTSGNMTPSLACKPNGVDAKSLRIILFQILGHRVLKYCLKCG